MGNGSARWISDPRCLARPVSARLSRATKLPAASERRATLGSTAAPPSRGSRS